MDDKIQIHQSMLSQNNRCGEQFRRRYGARFGWADREEIIPPGIALVTGIATHAAIEKNLTAKIETDELLSVEQVMDIARDEATGLFLDPVLLTDDEAADVKGTQGECVDMVITLALLHAIELAPVIDPKSVERKWVVELNGFPFDLAGRWDIEEKNGSIRDTKTAKRSPSQADADNSEQLTMYALAKKVCDGEEPSGLYIDALVKLKNPKAVTLQTTRTEAQRQILLNRVERFAEIIEKGAFTPANSTDWICNPKWCGYYGTCAFGGLGKKVI